MFVRSYNRTTNRSIVGKQVDKTSSEGKLERDERSLMWSAFQASQQTTENGLTFLFSIHSFGKIQNALL